MTNKERDEILISLVKGLNNLQVTVNEMRTEMKNMVTKEEFELRISKLATKEEISKLATKEEISKLATKEEISKLATKEEISKFVTKDEMSAKFDEQTALIRSEVVDAIKELSQISYERYIELKERIISNENEIKVIKLAIAN